MHIPVVLTYSIDDALQALGASGKSPSTHEILVLKAEDKFFNGGGCEGTRVHPGETPDQAGGAPRNVSVCMHSPLI